MNPIKNKTKEPGNIKTNKKEATKKNIGATKKGITLNGAVKKIPQSSAVLIESENFFIGADYIYKKLISNIKSYNPQFDIKLLDKAYSLAKKHHQRQLRKSGEPFIIHPLEVANILAGIELDQTSIISAILHDVIEDTDFTYEMLLKDFGVTIANIINGVTKLDKIVFSSREEKQVENLRKMIIAMSEDVRIILVKLADRLHNMKTLSYLPKEKRTLKAIETLEVYAPIAHRLGIHQIKTELEDLSFETLYPKQYEKIMEMVKEKVKLRQVQIDEAIKIVADKLNEVKISADISGRSKGYYSVYNKITQQNRNIDDIYDLIAIRIIVEDIKSCYAVLGIIHSVWKPLPGRFKDFIANPKFNMYQSLHTTVISNRGDPLEIQIRTFEMHKFAEYGIAAHYKYKEGIIQQSEFDKRIAWIRQLLDWQKELKDPQDYLESLKLDLFQEEIFVFTPKGKVINLPRGATPIDFAFQVHTDIGYNCIGAKIDGVMVPIESQLSNGNIVEIIVSKTPKGPSRDWLGIVKTSSARNKIKQWFSKEERQESYNTGRELLLKILRKNSMSFKYIPNRILEQLAKDLNHENVDALMVSIGSHKVSVHQIFTKIIKSLNLESEPEKEITVEDITKAATTPKQRGPGIIVKGMDNVLISVAK